MKLGREGNWRKLNTRSTRSVPHWQKTVGHPTTQPNLAVNAREAEQACSGGSVEPELETGTLKAARIGSLPAAVVQSRVHLRAFLPSLIHCSAVPH